MCTVSLTGFVLVRAPRHPRWYYTLYLSRGWRLPSCAPDSSSQLALLAYHTATIHIDEPWVRLSVLGDACVRWWRGMGCSGVARNGVRWGGAVVRV